MKRILTIIAVLSLTASASAQTFTRVGAFVEDGSLRVVTSPQSSISVELQVEKTVFTPGIYARYAQKYLGVRASLAARTETRIVKGSLSQLAITSSDKTSATRNEDISLPSNRLDARSLSAEEQASATAAAIFSLRKHRMDLITGEAGENVFGAGLRAALDEIDRLEKEYLAMFYGTTSVTTTVEQYSVTPRSDEKNYIVARYREGEGIVPIADLSGDMVMLCIAPKAVDTTGVEVADHKSKIFTEVLFAADCECTLVCGTNTLATAVLPLYQYGEMVKLIVK